MTKTTDKVPQDGNVTLPSQERTKRHMVRDPEAVAIDRIINELYGLPKDARQRVLALVAGKFSTDMPSPP